MLGRFRKTSGKSEVMLNMVEAKKQIDDITCRLKIGDCIIADEMVELTEDDYKKLMRGVNSGKERRVTLRTIAFQTKHGPLD